MLARTTGNGRNNSSDFPPLQKQLQSGSETVYNGRKPLHKKTPQNKMRHQRASGFLCALEADGHVLVGHSNNIVLMEIHVQF